MPLTAEKCEMHESQRTFDFIYENSFCVPAKDIELQGLPDFRKGKYLHLTTVGSECLSYGTNCSQAQKDTIAQIERVGTLTIAFFTQEVYFDFEDFEQPIKLRTKLF